MAEYKSCSTCNRECLRWFDEAVKAAQNRNDLDVPPWHCFIVTLAMFIKTAYMISPAIAVAEAAKVTIMLMKAFDTILLGEEANDSEGHTKH